MSYEILSIGVKSEFHILRACKTINVMQMNYLCVLILNEMMTS